MGKTAVVETECLVSHLFPHRVPEQVIESPCASVSSSGLKTEEAEDGCTLLNKKSTHYAHGQVLNVRNKYQWSLQGSKQMHY